MDAHGCHPIHPIPSRPEPFLFVERQAVHFSCNVRSHQFGLDQVVVRFRISWQQHYARHWEPSHLACVVFCVIFFLLSLVPGLQLIEHGVAVI